MKAKTKLWRSVITEYGLRSKIKVRMERIPKNGDEPEIYLFESAKELSEYLGHACTHGMYDPQANRIYATWSSLPHEIAHYKDFQSGKMKSEEISDRLRNELVAVLYSWQKQSNPNNFLQHEKEFLEAFYYLLETDGLKLDRPFEELSFKQIQSIADQLASHENPLVEKLVHLFGHYLDQAEVKTTY